MPSHYHATRVFAFWIVPCSSSAHSAPGKKATVPIHKVLVRPGRDLQTYQHRSGRTYQQGTGLPRSNILGSRVARLAFHRPNLRNLALLQVGWPKILFGLYLASSQAGKKYRLAFPLFSRRKSSLCRKIRNIPFFSVIPLQNFCDKCYFRLTLAF